MKNWREVGGPDQRIAFFNKEPGRGTWEVFANWACGDHKKAPEASFPEVGGNEETLNKVSSTRGAPEPFLLRVAEIELDDFRERLARTRCFQRRHHDRGVPGCSISAKDVD